MYQVCMLPCVVCFLKYVRNIEKCTKLHIYVVQSVSRCNFDKDDTHISRSLCSCIFHFKCGGRVGAPVIHGTDSHPPKINTLFPFSHPEPVQFTWEGDIAGLKSSGCSQSSELIYEFPFWYRTNEVCFEYQHLMISPRLPSVKKKLTERSVFMYI